ncbi:UNKNOWN [Stylonychia lemnae]|uniref:Uncharacterized protein n=1 Tax=Stylonychia lemnae TaxID=5949 RepID=A0A078AJR5_STYLE|nr:UNKNOWN [Stylonychia lemnae]|eukprot:CDW82131.1 UNKNOWN [Stylonychia lemnae]
MRRTSEQRSKTNQSFHPVQQTFGNQDSDDELSITCLSKDKSKTYNQTVKQNCRSRLDNLKLKATVPTKRAAITKIMLDEEDTSNQQPLTTNEECDEHELQKYQTEVGAGICTTPITETFIGDTCSDTQSQYPSLLELQKNNPFINKRLSIIKKTYKLQGSLSPSDITSSISNKGQLNLTSANLSSMNSNSQTAIVSRKKNGESQQRFNMAEETQKVIRATQQKLNRNRNSVGAKPAQSNNPLNNTTTTHTSEISQVRNTYNKLARDYACLQAMYDRADLKLKDCYLKLNNTIQINCSLQQELRTKNVTIDNLMKSKTQAEDKVKELKEENTKLQRFMIQGSKGSVLAEQNKDLREKLKVLEQERDKLENFYNHAQYEKKTKDDNIKVLQNAIEMRVDTICNKMGYTETDKSFDETPGGVYVELMKAKNELECERKLRQKLATRVLDLEKQLIKEKSRVDDYKFIRENDNQEIIRLEQEVQQFNQTLIRLEKEKQDLRQEISDLQLQIKHYLPQSTIRHERQKSQTTTPKQELKSINLSQQNQPAPSTATPCHYQVDLIKEKDKEIQILNREKQTIDDNYREQMQMMQEAIMELKQNYDALKVKVDCKKTLTIPTILSNDADDRSNTNQRTSQFNVTMLHSEESQKSLIELKPMFNELKNENTISFNLLVNNQQSYTNLNADPNVYEKSQPILNKECPVSNKSNVSMNKPQGALRELQVLEFNQSEKVLPQYQLYHQKPQQSIIIDLDEEDKENQSRSDLNTLENNLFNDNSKTLSLSSLM